MKLHMHHHTMVIYIQYKFHEIPEDGMTEGWMDKENPILLHLIVSDT